MRLGIILVCLVLILAVPAFAQKAPVLYTIDPGEVNPGGTVTVTGVNLGAASVSKSFLTDGANDIELVVVEQKDDTMQLRIPVGAKAGVYNIMLETKHDPPMLLVQPVKCTVRPVQPT